MSTLTYDGTTLSWPSVGNYKATSGMPNYQLPAHQCLKERGPVPEGKYYISMLQGGYAQDDGQGICQLKPSWQLQRIPRGAKAGSCEPYWANWGSNRIRFEPADPATKNACRPTRSGFYLHDSHKGYSHGCIEIEKKFFSDLRRVMQRTKEKKLYLTIKYSGGTTNGGTFIP